MIDLFEISKILSPLSKLINIGIIFSLRSDKGVIRQYSIGQISEKIRESKNKTFKYCKQLLEEGFLLCVNDSLVKREKGFVKLPGKDPIFKLSSKGLIAWDIIYFLQDQKKNGKIESIEEKITLSSVLGTIQESITKISDDLKELKKINNIGDK